MRVEEEEKEKEKEQEEEKEGEEEEEEGWREGSTLVTAVGCLSMRGLD